MSLTPGTRLGAYEIVALLGSGGMGEVYRARDTKLGRDVALKILPAEFAVDAERVARFRREAQVLASLNDPHIAAIYGFEDTDGVHALVLELVEGPTLADRIAQGPIPIDEALPIAKQIAEALEAAHEQGIIHRDLKPANIKVRPDGTVKVLDFGLAKLTDPMAGDAGAAGRAGGLALSQSPTITTPAMMTGVGTILGTAAYMSPEQAKGRPADKRSDIWAFGCVVYEMLTGARAFHGEDVSDTLAAILRGQPEWSALPNDAPAVLVALVKRCLEKDRRRRIGDVAAVLFALSEAATGLPAGASPTRVSQPRTVRRSIVAAVAVVVAGLTSALWWEFRPAAPPAHVSRFEIALQEGERFSDPQLQSIAISPDGTQLVYVVNRRLFVRPVADFAARAIPGTEDADAVMGAPVFSPDGGSIAFWSAGRTSGGAIKRVAVTGGTPVTICQTNGTNFFGMSWDSSGIIFSQRNGIKRVSPRGGTPDVLVNLASDEIAEGPRMLPGGDDLLFAVASVRSGATGPTNDIWERAQVVVQSLKSGRRRTLNVVGSDARYLPTGHLMYSLRGILFVVPFNLARREPTGAPFPAVEGVFRTAVGSIVTGSVQVAVSSSGSLAYLPGPVSPFGSDQSKLVLVDRAGTVQALNLPVGSYEHPRVSPNGKQIAFETNDGNQANVWIYELSGTSSPRQLTFDGKNQFPVWVDNSHVAFQSDREQDLAIFWQVSDGSAKAERLTKPTQGVEHIPDSSSGDAKYLLFTQSKDGRNSLWTLSLEEMKATPFGAVESPRLISPTFSPDGQWVAYTVTTNGRNQVFVEPFPPTGAKKYLIGTGQRPQWSPDGKDLFFESIPKTLVVGITMRPSFTVGNPTTLPMDVYAGRGPGFGRETDIMPDGQRFVTLVSGMQSALGASGARQIDVVLNWFEELKQRVPMK